MANILTASLPSFPPSLPPTLLLLLLGLLSPLPAEHWQFAAIFIQKCFYLFLLGIWQRHLVVQARHPVPVPASLGLGLGLILVVAAWFILMNVRLFVSSVFTDCQRDLLDALQAAGGRRGRQLLYTLPLLLHSHLHTHTHTGTQSHALRVYSRTAAHTHARTLAYAERQKLLHTLRKLTAFPFLARMQNNRIATSRALLRLTSLLLTSPYPYPYRTVPLRTIPFRIAPLLSLSLSSATCAEVLHSRFTYYNLEWLYFCAAVQYHLYTCHGLLLFCRYAWFLSSCFPRIRLINFPRIYSKKEICTNCWLYL